MNYIRKLFARRAPKDELNDRRPPKAAPGAFSPWQPPANADAPPAPPGHGPDDPAPHPNPPAPGVYYMHKVLPPGVYKGRKVNGRRRPKVAPSAYQPWTPPPKPDAPDQAGPAQTPTQ